MPAVLLISASGVHLAYADAPSAVDIVNFSGLCLGTGMEQCSVAQDWRFVAVPNQSGATLIRNVATGQCLDTLHHVLTPGDQVVTRACVFSGSNRFQLWHGESPTGGFEEFANEGDGPDLVMRPSCTSPPGSPVFMAERSQCSADLWRLQTS